MRVAARWVPLVFLLALSTPVAAQRTGTAAEARSALAAAEALSKNGKFADSLEQFRRALRLDPMLTEAYEGYANALFILGKHREGAQVSRQGLKQAPDNQTLQGHLGMHLYALGRTREAHGYLRKVLQSQAARFEIMAVAGQCCLKVQDAGCAVTALESYFKHRPDRLRAKDAAFRVLLSRAYRIGGEPGKALEQVETVLRKDRKNLAARAAHAQAQLALKQCGPALAALEKLKAELKAEQFASLRLDLGRAYLCAGRFREALREAQAWLQRTPDDTDALLLQADASARLRRYDQALAIYRKLLALQDSAAIRTQMAELLFVQKKYAAALTEVERALKQDRPSEDALTLGLRAALRLKKKDRALSFAERLLTLPSPGASVFYYAGMAHSSSGKFERALELYEKALALDGKHRGARGELVRAAAYLARAAYRKNELPAAVAHLQRALKHDPASLVLNRNLALCFMRQGKPAEALERLEVIFKRVPRDYVANRLAARTLLGLGRTKQALERLDLAVATVYRHGGVALAQVLAESGLVRLKLDQVDRAVAELERALELSRGMESAFELAAGVRANLARAYTIQAFRLLDGDKPKAAWAVVQKGRPLLEGLPPGERAVAQLVALLGAVAAGQAEDGKALLASLTLARKGSALRAPFDKLGKPFLAAYLDLASPVAAVREKAAARLATFARRVPPGMRKLLQALAASVQQSAAVAFFRQGNIRAAQKAMGQARKLDASASPRERHNMAVLDYRAGNKGAAVASLEKLRGTVPLAACNLAVHREQVREMAKAFELFRECERRGGGYPGLKQILATKERIHGEVSR